MMGKESVMSMTVTETRSAFVILTEGVNDFSMMLPENGLNMSCRKHIRKRQMMELVTAMNMGVLK